MKIETKDNKHFFEVQVYLNELTPDAIKVELFAEGLNGNDPIKQEMKRLKEIADIKGGYIYAAQVVENRPSSDYTPRLIPYHTDALVPLETTQILWR
jgi:starch phosphorylase